MCLSSYRRRRNRAAADDRPHSRRGDSPGGLRSADCVQTVRRVDLTLTPPSMDDQTDDWSAIPDGAASQAGIDKVQASLPLLRQLGRDAAPGRLAGHGDNRHRSLGLPRLPGTPHRSKPGHTPEDTPLWGAAIDIGTTTVTVWLVDLLTGKVRAQVSEYNGQIARGEDVISRIIYASKKMAGRRCEKLVLETINGLIETACNACSGRPGRHGQGDHRRQQHHDPPAAAHPGGKHPPGAVRHRRQSIRPCH